MFLSDFEHSLDEKNRVVLPSPYRRGFAEEALQGRFYLVPSDEDECLELYPQECWEKHVTNLKTEHRFGSREWREFIRDFYSSASEIQLDKQYRFILPEASKNAAGIRRDVYFVGLGEFMEIWAKERWLARKEERKGKRKTPSREGD
jgi:MraZ protein